MEQSFTISYLISWDLNTKSGATVKSYLPISTVLNFGRPVGTILSTRKICTPFKTLKRSMASSLWIVLGTALCSTWFKNLTEIYLSEWLISVSFTETNSKEPYLDLQELEDSNKTTLTFFAEQIRSRYKFWVSLTWSITSIQCLASIMCWSYLLALRNSWATFKTGTWQNLNSKKLLVNSASHTKLTKEMVLSMAQR